MQHVKRLTLPFLFVLVLPMVALAADELLVSAKQQLDNGNPQAAYNLLIPLQSERGGDPEYDFLLGSAALGIGKNTEAVFALERVLAVRPDSAPARALIARAYFNLKETETAKREFENVKKQDIPPEVSATIDRFLDAITRIEDSQRTTIRGFVELGIGYDTNVNSATSDSQVAVPAFGGAVFTLASNATKLGDAFVSYAAGVNVTRPMSKTLSLFGGAAFQKKMNHNEDEFDTYSYDANLGLSYKRDRDVFTLGAQHNSFYVDDTTLYQSAYRRASGAIVQWQHDFDARNQVSFFFQYTDLTYPEQRIRDADRYVGGAGYAHAFGRGTLITYLGVYGGSEKQKDESVPQLGNDLYGARLGAQWNINEKFALFLNASGEQRKYGGDDPFFLVTRKDHQYNASTGLIFVPSKGLRVTPQVGWTRNDSNIQTDQFDRLVYQVTVRYDM